MFDSLDLILRFSFSSRRVVPNPPKPEKKPQCQLKFGKWTEQRDSGKREEKSVLIKSIHMFHEREVSS